MNCSECCCSGGCHTRNCSQWSMSTDAAGGGTRLCARCGRVYTDHLLHPGACAGCGAMQCCVAGPLQAGPGGVTGPGTPVAIPSAAFFGGIPAAPACRKCHGPQRWHGGLGFWICPTCIPVRRPDGPPPPPQALARCECGAAKCGLPGHSDWCPAAGVVS